MGTQKGRWKESGDKMELERRKLSFCSLEFSREENLSCIRVQYSILFPFLYWDVLTAQAAGSLGVKVEVCPWGQAFPA